ARHDQPLPREEDDRFREGKPTHARGRRGDADAVLLLRRVQSRARQAHPRRRAYENHVAWSIPMTHTGRHFLQIPGPTNLPDRVLRAIDQPIIDHRGPAFARLTAEVLERIRPVFGTTGPVIIFPSSGTGACEAALVNTLSPGDRVAILETGWFSS